MGSWTKITGFLGDAPKALSAPRLRSRLLTFGYLTALCLFFAGVLYLRETTVAGSGQQYLYLEMGGTLLCFCYSAKMPLTRGWH